eukprot:CAMPEP_0175057132 /NCGR_PEP_ID=MMETSP0052_2-20121109/11086_1 /TAXON_ID=51329 ORGANISM="Polytomella parva, Strain SAG 63-3" /NCGR_SAMPLE_ID=MMETSP0052_2 /ASSEMBLY_ACC=CAM_ASM_000194 /LENGTH=174 /DNA_ID=CAMNT_0016322295 /DNA_START=110 /DNA_END=634 /DNA_ORIENTATION=+
MPANGYNKLGRTPESRMNLVKKLLTELVEKERITTTFFKACFVQRYGDKLITLGKEGTREAWLKANDIVRTDRELHKVFTTLAMRYKDRKGGYIRLLRAGTRKGDNAHMAIIEFVDREGELRPARPAIMEIPRFSVMRWVKHQIDPSVELKTPPLLPPLVKEYLKQQQSLEKLN